MTRSLIIYFKVTQEIHRPFIHQFQSEDKSLISLMGPLGLERVIVFELKKIREIEHLTKIEVAKKIHTSRLLETNPDVLAIIFELSSENKFPLNIK